MRGLIETAIEREAERIDEIIEPGNTTDVPFFAPRHFRSRVRPQTRRFAPHGHARRRFSQPVPSSAHYVN
jgi:hypothetical protein